MKWKNDLFVYFLVAVLLMPLAFFTVRLFVLFLLLFSFIYLPLLFSLRDYTPLEKREEKEELTIGEDIAHFRETIDKALRGNPVAQRDIELRLINSVVVALSIRYDLSESKIRRNLENEDFLKKYVGGSRAKMIRDMYMRRHDLKLSIPRDRFVKELREIMEAMK